MKRIRLSTNRTTRPLLFALLLLVMVATPVLAAAYYATFTIVETDGTASTNLPVSVNSSNLWMSNNGFMSANGLDTRVETYGGTELPHLLSDNLILAVADVPANSNVNLLFTTGNSYLTDMPIITGYGGYVTVDDAAALEPGSYFDIETQGYIDTSLSDNKDIVYKEDAFRTYISAEDTIRSAVLAAGDAEAVAVNAYDISSGVHKVKTALAPGDTTTQMLFVGGAGDADQATTRYAPLQGYIRPGATSWTTSGVHTQEVMPAGGTLTNFQAMVFVAPGATKSWDFTVRVNSVDTVLSVSISDNEVVSAVDTDDIAVLAGDMIEIKCDPTNTPTAMDGAYLITEFIPDAIGETVLFADTGIWDIGDGRYIAFAGNYGIGDTTLERTNIVIPTAGTIKKLYVDLETAPGLGDSWVCTVYLNGVATDLVVTVSGDSDTTGSNIVDSFAVTAGDRITLGTAAVSTPTNSYGSYAVVFLPDTPGEWFTPQVITGIAWSDGITRYTGLPHAGGQFYTAETDAYTLAHATTAKALYAITDYTPTTYMDFALRVNGAGSALSANITNPDILGSDTDDVVISLSDNISIEFYADNVPGAEPSIRLTAVSVLFYNAPTVGDYVQLFVDDVLEDSVYYAGSVPDTANDWILARNNIMPYMDYYKHTIGGFLVAHYQPDEIILTTVLPDLEGAAQDGEITWGSNLSGIAVTLGPMLSSDQPVPGSTETESPDILPPTEGSDWYASPDLVALAANPFYQVVAILSDLSESSPGAGDGFTETQIWRFFAMMAILILVAGAAIAVPGHLFIASVACCAGIWFAYALTIFPMAALVAIIPVLIAGLLMERSPSL